MYLPGYAVAQNMIQRYVCTGGVREARGVVALGAAMSATLGFVFLLVGVAIFAVYTQPGGSGMPVLAREDQILPHFVATRAPGVGLVGLLLAGLFAAAMSTLDSGINGVASVIVYDWLGGRELSLRASRTLTSLLGAGVIGAALLAPLLGSTVIDIISTIASTLLGGLMAVFLLGIFAPRANAPGVLIGLAAGAASLGVVVATTSLPSWWYGAFAIAPTLLVGVAASQLFPPPRPETLAGTIWGPNGRGGPLARLGGRDVDPHSSS